MANLTSNLTVKITDGLTGPAKAMGGSLGRLGADLKKLDKIDVFQNAMKSMAEARTKFRAAQTQVEQLAKQFAAARRASDAMASPEASRRVAELGKAYERAQRSVSAAARAFERQKSAVLEAKGAITSSGVAISKLTSEQNRLRAAVDKTNASLQRQARFGGLGRLGGGLAALGAGYGAQRLGRKAVVSAAEFDIGVRKQRAFTDISAADQNAILVPQAKKIGQDTQFSNLDVVKAQTAAMQGLPSNISGRAKAQTAAGILENVKNYALVMEADLETSAQAIRSYLQTTGQDISTPEKALAAANKATNQLVRMAKLGGMSDEDVQGYLKFAAASGTAVGLSPESLMAIGALARRGGLRGDEAGVFMRATAGKLASPTKGGLTAMNSAGIKYSDYVKMPGSLDVGRLEGQFQTDLGMNFSPKVRARLSAILADPSIIADRGRFTAAVTGAVEPMFPKTKKGRMSAASRQKVAKSAGAFHKTSAASVDSEGLLDALMGSNLSLAQLNEIVTGKHGGKFSITQRQREEYVAARQQLRAAGDDPDFAKKKADEIMGGLGGSFERLKGSVENLILGLGTANEKVLTFGMDKIGAVLDAFSNLPGPVQQVATAFGALGGAWAGFAGLKALIGGFGLSTSAVALNTSAAALTAAAVRLGAPSLPGGPAASPKSRLGMLAAGARFLPGFGLALAGGYAAYGLYNGEGKVDPGDAGDRDAMWAGIARRKRHGGAGPGASFGSVGSGLTSFGLGGPRIDAGTLDQVWQRANETNENLDKLSTPRRAAVDSSEIERAIGLTRSLLAELGKVGEAASGLATSIQARAGRETRTAMRSLYSDYGVQETG